MLNNVYYCPRLKQMFTFKEVSNLRGQSLKLKKEKFKIFSRQYVFISRNSLPDEIINASNLNILKNKLDNHM